MGSAALLIIAAVLVAVTTAQHQQLFAPTFAWSNSDARAVDLSQETVSYLHSSRNSLAGSLVLGRTEASAVVNGTDNAEVSLIILGNHLTVQQYRQLAISSGTFDELQQLASEAKYSSTFYTAVEKGGFDAAVVAEHLSLVTPNLVTVDCGESSTTLAGSIEQAIASAALGTVNTILVCLNEASIQEEVAQVVSISRAAADSGLRYAMLYTNSPSKMPEVEHRARRQLLGGAFGGYTDCDELCQSQVKFLEIMMALLVLILAAVSGLCCLNLLETPTKFEGTKESATQ